MKFGGAFLMGCGLESGDHQIELFLFLTLA